MAKKKPQKKPAKSKAANKLVKKIKKALSLKPSKAAKPVKPAAKSAPKAKLVAKPAKEKGKPAALKGKPVVEAKVAKEKGKKGKKAGEVVEVVIAPSNPLLKDIRKNGAPKETAASKKRCRETACDQDGLMAGYCRLHYIKNWRRIKRKEAILASGQLNNYVEELVKKYPDKYLDVIRQDLASEKEWAKVVVDLELESGDDEAGAEDELDPVAEGVRRDRDFDEEDSGF